MHGLINCLLAIILQGVFMGAFKDTLKALGTDHKAVGLLHKGTTIAECKGIDARLLEGIYALGHQHYKNKNFELSSKIFRYLCIHDHTDSRYMTALGASEYQRGEYLQAQYILENAVDLDPRNPDACLNLAMSQIAQNEYQQAAENLKQTINLSKGKTAYAGELRSAQTLLNNITENNL